MAQAEPSIVSTTYGGENGGVVSASESCSSSDAVSSSANPYVTAPALMVSCSHNESVEYETARMIEKSREQGWSELKDDAEGSSGHDQDSRVIWEELKRGNPNFFRDDWEVELGRVIAREVKPSSTKPGSRVVVRSTTLWWRRCTKWKASRWQTSNSNGPSQPRLFTGMDQSVKLFWANLWRIVVLYTVVDF